MNFTPCFLATPPILGNSLGEGIVMASTELASTERFLAVITAVHALLVSLANDILGLLPKLQG